MSKPAAPAKSAKSARQAAKPVAAKKAVKAPARTAPKPAPKAPARSAVRPAPKAAPRSAAKAASQPAERHAARPPAVQAQHTARHSPAKATPATPAPTVTDARRAAGTVVSSAGSAAAPAAATPATSQASFTDRFAPSRPAAAAPTEPRMSFKPARKIDPKLANAWKTKSGAELTEDELLAMPDDEYMNDKQLDFFRNRLQQQKDDLLSNADQTTENLREDTTIVPDPADRATIEEEHALELRTRDRERKLLKKIAQSLARIESGDYGYCDETGEPIGVARLLARPTATLSLEAQQRRELKQKMFGD